MAPADAVKLVMPDSNVEDGHSSDDIERVVPATRAKQYGKGLLMITLVLAVLAGGVAIFQRPGSGNAAISQSVKLAPVGKNDLAGFKLRLQEHTKGRSWPEICTIFSQVQDVEENSKADPQDDTKPKDSNCEIPNCDKETMELNDYYKATPVHQPLIDQIMVQEAKNAGVQCGHILDFASPSALAPVGTITDGSLSHFTERLSAHTRGKPWTQICPIYSFIKDHTKTNGDSKKPCTAGVYCTPETQELNRYYNDNEKEQRAIKMFMLIAANRAGVSCYNDLGTTQ